MTTITSRAGCFTSSNIYKLMTDDKKGGIGKPGLTYIETKRREILLGRQMEQQKSFRSAAWGTMLQHRVLNLMLGMEYKPMSDKRFVHAELPWNGSPDFVAGDRAGDVKCFELDNFTYTHDAASAGLDKFKEDCPEIYWQLVSNAVLYKVTMVELVLYVPYKDELSVIRSEEEWSKILTPDQFDNKDFKWWINSLSFMSDDELPYLIPGKHYKNLSSFIFDVPETDSLHLINRVQMAAKLLKP